MKFLKLRNIIISFSFLLTAIVLCIDNQPQSFPLSEDAETPDCSKIAIINISNDINRIRVSMRAWPPFIEFPIEASAHLINITTETPISFVSYTYDDFWDFNASYKNINSNNILAKVSEFDYFEFNFNILQTINGNVSVSVFCNQIKLEKELIKEKAQENQFYVGNARDSNSVTVFNFSIDEIRYYPIGWSKIESSQMQTLKISGFSILKSNLIFHSTTISEIKPFHFGPRHYNVSIDVRSSIQFCGYSNQSYYIDEVFLVSGQSINELNPQFFFKNCILRMFFTIQQINDNNMTLINETVNKTEMNESISKSEVHENLNSLSISDIKNQTENFKNKNSFPIKLLIINDTINNTEIQNESLILSNGKYQSFKNLFGSESIEIINMENKKCFREGIFFPVENNVSYLNDDVFLSKIDDDYFNISRLKNIFINKNENLNNSTKIKTLIDSADNVLNSSNYTLLNISDDITEMLNMIHNCEKFIVSKIENLPFALFMNEGAELIQIEGNKHIGERISMLNKLSKFTYYKSFTQYKK